MKIITLSLSPAIDLIVACDQLQVGAHQMAHQISRTAAGKAINVSRALAAMGVSTVATGFVGSADADFFAAELARSAEPAAADPPNGGTIACKLQKLDQPTRQNITIISGQGETHLRMTGFSIGRNELAALCKQITSLAHRDDLVVLAGSVPESLMVAEGGLWLELVHALQAAGLQIALDTSGPALRAFLSEPLLVAKPNLNEWNDATGQTLGFDPPTIAAAARRLMPQTKYRLISCGEKGAVLTSDTLSLWGRLAAPGPVKRTVGCGDFLLAGFIAGVAANQSPQEALRRGLAAATARAISVADARDALEPKLLARLAAMADVQMLNA